MRAAMRLAGVAAAILLLAGCARTIPEGPELPKPQNALAAGIAAGPAVESLGLGDKDARAALASFIESCPRLTSRADASGLASPESWQSACREAPGWPKGEAGQFFARYFETVQVGDGEAFATGYFEPEIAGVRTRQPGFDVPVYKMPPELVRAWPDSVPESARTGRPPLGRYDASGAFVPYYTRGEIEDGAIANRGLEIAWVADPVEFFFLQIQGSGRLRAPDGSVMRIGYAGQNGRDYTGIGKVMRDRGLFGSGPGQYPGSMQGIMAYIHDHPEEGRELMRMNQSWVFFRELTGDGPLGALGVPVRAHASVAADPKFVPLGAPVWLAMDRKDANGLWIAQDTGGAIKGANRFDTFWGAGDHARETAGGMSAHGKALLLLPKGTLAKLHKGK